MFLNEATLLDNLKARYFKDKIYVSPSIDNCTLVSNVVFNAYVVIVLHSSLCLDLCGQHSDSSESVQGDSNAVRWEYY